MITGKRSFLSALLLIPVLGYGELVNLKPKNSRGFVSNTAARQLEYELANF